MWSFLLVIVLSLTQYTSGFTSTVNSRHRTSTQLSMTWYDEDKTVNIVPRFKIKEGKKEQYIALLPKFVELVKANEEGTCVYYGFVGPTEDDLVICREGYKNAEGLLKHLDNVGEVLNEALTLADIVDLAVHGPAEELEKLKEPLKDFGPAYYPTVEGAIMTKK